MIFNEMINKLRLGTLKKKNKNKKTKKQSGDIASKN